ncbi:hypothetical protein HJFPF1_00296 [Paramyrothecium foliicola]|nr:hypothetical protein HJFPF1_00296 [Paramyrothecium foliicola]
MSFFPFLAFWSWAVLLVTGVTGETGNITQELAPGADLRCSTSSCQFELNDCNFDDFSGDTGVEIKGFDAPPALFHNPDEWNTSLLPGGQNLPKGPYDIKTLKDNWNGACVKPPFRLPDSYSSFAAPNDLVFECLGSNTRMADFLLLERALNSRKAKCFSSSLNKPSPISETILNVWISQAVTDPAKRINQPLQGVREILGLWSYLGLSEVVASINGIQNCLSTAFKEIERSCTGFAPKTPTDLTTRQYWVQFDRTYWDSAVYHCKNKAEQFLDLISFQYETKLVGSALLPQARDTIAILRSDLAYIRRPNQPPL